MKKLIPLLILAALTSGFTWGKTSTEKCEEAKQLAYGLASNTNRESRLETESSIRQLCAEGPA
ncbi:MAG TPA: hypothetical protein VFF53_12150, partial [Geobacteraceae bacterium]|nr:hypothetical protein [Geobacteraceae bacterium]